MYVAAICREFLVCRRDGQILLSSLPMTNNISVSLVCMKRLS